MTWPSPEPQVPFQSAHFPRVDGRNATAPTTDHGDSKKPLLFISSFFFFFFGWKVKYHTSKESRLHNGVDRKTSRRFYPQTWDFKGVARLWPTTLGPSRDLGEAGISDVKGPTGRKVTGSRARNGDGLIEWELVFVSDFKEVCLSFLSSLLHWFSKWSRWAKSQVLKIQRWTR